MSAEASVGASGHISPLLMQGLYYGHKLLAGQHQSAHYGLLLAPVVSC